MLNMLGILIFDCKLMNIQLYKLGKENFGLENILRVYCDQQNEFLTKIIRGK